MLEHANVVILLYINLAIQKTEIYYTITHRY